MLRLEGLDRLEVSTHLVLHEVPVVVHLAGEETGLGVEEQEQFLEARSVIVLRLNRWELPVPGDSAPSRGTLPLSAAVATPPCSASDGCSLPSSADSSSAGLAPTGSRAPPSGTGPGEKQGLASGWTSCGSRSRVPTLVSSEILAPPPGSHSAPRVTLGRLRTPSPSDAGMCLLPCFGVVIPSTPTVPSIVVPTIRTVLLCSSASGDCCSTSRSRLTADSSTVPGPASLVGGSSASLHSLVPDTLAHTPGSTLSCWPTPVLR